LNALYLGFIETDLVPRSFLDQAIEAQGVGKFIDPTDYSRYFKDITMTLKDFLKSSDRRARARRICLISRPAATRVERLNSKLRKILLWDRCNISTELLSAILSLKSNAFEIRDLCFRLALESKNFEEEEVLNNEETDMSALAKELIELAEN